MTARRRGLRTLAVLVLACGAALSAAPWRWHPPTGTAPPSVPADNPVTPAKIALGRRLFYDADLSIDGTMDCATCHEQRRGFADGNRTRPGVHGDPGRRNVPGLANIAWLTPLTSADPTLATLEAQILVPVLGDHPVEMGMKGGEAEIARRLGRDACYREMFGRAFPESGGRIDMPNVARALASFERTLVSFDSSYDRYRRDMVGMPEPALRGLALFERDCAICHQGPAFSDGRYHAIASPMPGNADPGLFETTGRPEDRGRFRTASLRNVALAAPYLHDGSAGNLQDAIRAHRLVPGVAGLTVATLDDLAAFIVQLNDGSFIRDPRQARPDKACGRRGR